MHLEHSVKPMAIATSRSFVCCDVVCGFLYTRTLRCTKCHTILYDRLTTDANRQCNRYACKNINNVLAHESNDQCLSPEVPHRAQCIGGQHSCPCPLRGKSLRSTPCYDHQRSLLARGHHSTPHDTPMTNSCRCSNSSATIHLAIRGHAMGRHGDDAKGHNAMHRHANLDLGDDLVVVSVALVGHATTTVLQCGGADLAAVHAMAG